MLQLAAKCCRAAADRTWPLASPVTGRSNAKKGLSRVTSHNMQRKPPAGEKAVLETALMQNPIFSSDVNCIISLGTSWYLLQSIFSPVM